MPHLELRARDIPVPTGACCIMYVLIKKHIIRQYNVVFLIFCIFHTANSFSYDIESGKTFDSSSTKFTEDFIKKMEEWEQMKGLSKL